jgi:hypothetical protein
MTAIGRQLDQMRIAVGEVEVLAALAVEFYDRSDLSGADPIAVEKVAYLLGVIERSSSAALVAFNRLHVAVADAQPAESGDRWTGEDTATGDE